MGPGIAVCLLSSCAVRGYELGWRADDRIATLLGEPRDALSGCLIGQETPREPSGPCRAVAREITAILSETGGRAGALSGFRCRETICIYQNVFERRDIGLASIVPVNRKIVLREAHVTAERGSSGAWRLVGLRIRDNAPPGYGPVRIGG